MWKQIWDWYIALVAGWCGCNLIWLLTGNNPSIGMSIATISLVGIEMIVLLSKCIITLLKAFGFEIRRKHND